MKIVLMIFVVLSIICGVGSSVVWGQKDEENKATSGIRGSVVNLLGTPINGPAVTFLVNGMTVSKTFTLTDGKFNLAGTEGRVILLDKEGCIQKRIFVWDAS